MDENKSKDIIQYLKAAIDLEFSVYTQEEAIKRVKQKLESSLQKIRKEKFTKPTKPTMKTIEKPERQMVSEKSAGCLIVFFGPICLMFGLWSLFNGELVLVGLFLTIVGGAFTYTLISAPHYNKKKQEEYDEQYTIALANYDEQCEKNKND